MPSDDSEPQDSNENEIPDISQSIQNSIDDIKDDILMDLANGEAISVQDITCDNMNLMVRIRTNIQNSI